MRELKLQTPEREQWGRCAEKKKRKKKKPELSDGDDDIPFSGLGKVGVGGSWVASGGRSGQWMCPND